jgi:hypothetical protein
MLYPLLAAAALPAAKNILILNWSLYALNRIYRVGHKWLDTSKRFKCIFVKRLMAHPVIA